MTLNTPSKTPLDKPENIINSEPLSQQSQSQEEPGQTSTDIPTHLHCSCCDQMLPIDNFSNCSKNRYRYGKQAWCQLCSNKRVNDYKKENPLKTMMQNALYRRDHDFEIDEEYMQSFDIDVCPILGIPMQWGIGAHFGQGRNGASNQSNNSKSLDRIDSTKGYLKGNVHIISWRANNLKKDATLEEMVLLGEWALQQLINEITY